MKNTHKRYVQTTIEVKRECLTLQTAVPASAVAMFSLRTNPKAPKDEFQGLRRDGVVRDNLASDLLANQFGKRIAAHENEPHFAVPSCHGSGLTC